MLKLKPNCECCDTDLPADAANAVMCSFECTFCRDCAEQFFNGICPNCRGELVRRPNRPAEKLVSYPVSSERFKEHPECAGSYSFTRMRRTQSSAGGGRCALRVSRSRDELNDLQGKVIRVNDAQRRKGHNGEVNAKVGSGFCNKQAVNTASQEGRERCKHQCDLSSVEISFSHDGRCAPC